MKRYQVRCCCQPQKLLGSVHGPDLDGPGQFTVRLKSFYEKNLKSQFLGHTPSVKIFDEKEIVVKVMWLRLDMKTRPILAIYSEDRPIEFWRNVSGFEECENG